MQLLISVIVNKSQLQSKQKQKQKQKNIKKTKSLSLDNVCWITPKGELSTIFSLDQFHYEYVKSKYDDQAK